MFPNENRQFQLRMKSHLRSGITPALFELDILRYEQLRTDGVSSNKSVAAPSWDLTGRLLSFARRTQTRFVVELQRFRTLSVIQRLKAE